MQLDEIFDLNTEKELGLLCALSQIQDSFRMRVQRRSLALAHFLIDDRGELKTAEVKTLLESLEKDGHIFYSAGPQDHLLLDHHLAILRKLSDPAFYKLIKKFQKPFAHKGVEALFKEVVPNAVLSDAEIRRAVLSAVFALLRQNVGSCFATAPAILIHENYPEKFLTDLYELVTTGKLKRTFAGNEHAVPLSPSTGVGDLKKLIGEHPEASPGLMAGFNVTQEILSGLIVKKKIAVETLIREVLLEEFDLKKSDLKVKSPFSRSFFGASSKKQETLEKFFQKEKEVKAAFKAVADHPLLKAWEFTLASLSEIKMEFSKWNLYSSLGLNPSEPGGVGEVLYHYLNAKLQESNQRTQEVHQQYEIAFDQLRATELLLKNAVNESEIRRLRAEHQSRYFHMQSCLELRNRIHSQSAHYPNFFNFLMKQYEEKFPEYFQEIYDAEMQDITHSTHYEDSPAGFRLVYKHGRKDASSWTFIRSASEWIEALANFFTSIEASIAEQTESDAAKEDVFRLTTDIVSHLRTGRFLETAILRMAKAHHIELDPSSDLEKLEKKPWAYTSGGDMDTLIKTYFRRETLTKESRTVESAMDLLIFILDTLKSLPPSVFQKKGMLMLSPNHAFILHPEWELIQQGWQDPGFTYTWVRDHFLNPREEFFDKMLLSPIEQRFLIDRFSAILPPLAAHQCQMAYISGNSTIPQLRNKILEHYSDPDKLDSFLYESLPLVSAADYQDTLRKLVPTDQDSYLDFFSTRKDVEDAAKAILLATNPTADVHQTIAKRSTAIGLAPPPPLLFADTNWPTFYFGLLVNPSTGSLELWRMDPTGSSGIPMSSWKQWLNHSTLPWTIYTHPHEYSE